MTSQTYSHITSQEARKGEVVTTINNEFNAYGIGYLVNGVVWVTTGSYWARRADDDVFPMDEYICDGGKAYRQQICPAL